jgi:hypothetical protein
MAIWYILWPFGIFYGHLVYFMAIWYILWPFGIFYGHLVYFMAISYILWPFRIFYGHLVYFMAISYILWPFVNLVVFRYIFPALVNYVKKNLATPSQCDGATNFLCVHPRGEFFKLA